VLMGGCGGEQFLKGRFQCNEVRLSIHYLKGTHMFVGVGLGKHISGMRHVGAKNWQLLFNCWIL